MVERRGGQVQPTVSGSLGPPVGKGELGTGVAHAVEGGQGNIGPHRCPGVGAARPHHVVDYLGHLEPAEHVPDRRDVAEGQVASAVRHHRGAGDGGFDIGGFAQVALGDNLGLAPDAGHLSQVVIGLPPDGLADDGRHILGHTPHRPEPRVFDQDKRAGSGLILEILRRGWSSGEIR